MPTYDYECQKCGFTFELFQGINDPPRSRCPLCRGKVQRLIGAGVGIVFKGSGFYVTDTRQGKAGRGESAGKSASGKTGESASGGPAARKTSSQESTTGTSTSTALQNGAVKPSSSE